MCLVFMSLPESPAWCFPPFLEDSQLFLHILPLSLCSFSSFSGNSIMLVLFLLCQIYFLPSVLYFSSFLYLCITFWILYSELPSRFLLLSLSVFNLFTNSIHWVFNLSYCIFQFQNLYLVLYQIFSVFIVSCVSKVTFYLFQ